MEDEKEDFLARCARENASGLSSLLPFLLIPFAPT
jgi:hypothetical protein